MTDTIQKALQSYIEAVEKELPCSRKQKKILMNHLRADLEASIEAAGESPSKEKLISHFGQPKTVAEEFLKSAEYSEIKRSISSKRFVVVCIVSTCILALALILGYLIYDHWRVENFVNGYATETSVYSVTELPDDLESPPEGTQFY